MFKAFVLVRNLESNAERLDFGEFTIKPIGSQFQELRTVFSSIDVNQDDWLFEKSYNHLPLGAPGSPVGGIPDDVEDVLLLLRLYQPGDISFIKNAIVIPSGNTLVQLPYRAMNDLNSYSPLKFQVDQQKCEDWRAFAVRVRESQSWGSDWFASARRFFLSGGAKQFNPEWREVDRILDYVMALESTLVPENDYNTRRISRRGANLIASVDLASTDLIKFITKLYEIRSRIVHGSKLDDKTLDWLSGNFAKIELRVRQILATAVQKLPGGEEERGAALARLYDPTDDDRGELMIEKFRQIKKSEVRKDVAAKIVSLAGF